MTAPESWGHSVGAFERRYPGWRIASDGSRYTAQRKTDRGPRGPVLRARTLDELAALIDAAEGTGQ